MKTKVENLINYNKTKIMNSFNTLTFINGFSLKVVDDTLKEKGCFVKWGEFFDSIYNTEVSMNEEKLNEIKE